MLINTAAYYTKLANHETIAEDEIVALLKELARFRSLAAHLASCHAATAESLPKSASKSSRGRHVLICQTAANAMRGDMSGIRCSEPIDRTIERCEKVVKNQALG